MHRLLRVLLIGVSLAAPPLAAAQEVPTREGWAVADDGVRLFYRVYGDRGDTLVYLHGGPGGTFERQMPNLLPLARTHVVVAYDQRGGVGRSDVGDTTRITPARHVEDFEVVRRHLGFGRATLFGHSWGTGLAVMYADAHPAHVARLILNGPMPPARTPFDAERNASVGARRTELCARMLGADAPTDQVEQCARRPAALARVYFADTLNMRRDRGVAREDGLGGAVGLRATLRALGDWDYRPALRRIRVPALVVEGARTPVPLDHVRIWAQTLPDARLLLVEGAGHAYAYIENPETFFPAIEDFLAGRWPSRAEVVQAR